MEKSKELLQEIVLARAEEEAIDSALVNDDLVNALKSLKQS